VKRREPNRESEPEKATPPLLVAAVVAAAIILHLILAAINARGSSATADEPIHLTAGYTYLTLGDYRLNPEHPPLVKMIAALPLLPMELWPANGRGLTGAEVGDGTIMLDQARRVWGRGLRDIAAAWSLGHYFLYGVDDATMRSAGVAHKYDLPTAVRYERSAFLNDADRVLFAGRLSVLLCGGVLALVLFFWGRELHGTAGGMIALLLFAFEPSFISHGALVTTDVPVCAALTGAAWFLWRSFGRISLLNFAGLAFFCILAATSKYSSVLFFVMLPVLALVRAIRSAEWTVAIGPERTLSATGTKIAAAAALVAAVAIATWGGIWAVYGFRHSAAPDPATAAGAEIEAIADDPDQQRLLMPNREPGYLPIERVIRKGAVRRAIASQYPDGVPDEAIERELMTARLGAGDRLLLFIANHHLLPEAFTYGFAWMRGTPLRDSYLRGVETDRGFASYFFWTILFKTPLVTLAALLMALWMARRFPWRESLPILTILPAAYFVVAMVQRTNIGHRHILPVMPFLFVIASGLAVWWRAKPADKRKRLAVAFVALTVIAPVIVFAPPWKPQVVIGQDLAYFNELSGGPLQGDRLLLDSNLDWGQDLKRLRSWLDENNVQEPVNLLYFGTADPRFHGIPFLNMPLGYEFAAEAPLESMRRPGYLVVSANHRAGVFYTDEGRAFWAPVLAGARLVDRVGYSLWIYRVE
jgi:4-amino-4-deoxy-L-arabinose transferase-like glycosyltransferase